MYQNILFDLDGTITDSAEGIYNSIRFALEKLGQAQPETQLLKKFIGPPLIDSFQEFCGLSYMESEQGVALYREYYREQGIFENRVYDEVEATLLELNQAGKAVYIATSKPEPFAKQILEHFELVQYFQGVYGATLDGTRSKKADVIHYALHEAGISEKAQTIMVGDRSHDILGAKENGLDNIGVLYGFGSREELVTAGADYLVETPLELLPIVG